MSKLEELKEQLDKIQKEINNLESKEWPKIGDTYYLVDSLGEVHDYRWDGDSTDEDCKAQGNIFKTSEEAISESLSRKITQELWQCEGARKCIRGQYNWMIKVCDWSVCFDCGGLSYFNVYFDTQEQVQNAIKTVGTDRLNKVVNWQEFGETFTVEK